MEIMNITLEDYRECLKNDVDLPSYKFYVSRINFILEQENVDFQYFVNNLAYYKYKYKYLVQTKDKSINTYINKVEHICFNKKTENLEISLKTDKNLDIEEFEKIKRFCKEISTSNRTAFDNRDIVSVQEIKKGSISLTFVLSSVLFVFNFLNAVAFIKEIKNNRNNLGAKGYKKCVVKAALLILKIIANVLSISGVDFCLLKDIELSANIVDELIDLISRMLGE